METVNSSREDRHPLMIGSATEVTRSQEDVLFERRFDDTLASLEDENATVDDDIWMICATEISLCKYKKSVVCYIAGSIVHSLVNS